VTIVQVPANTELRSLPFARKAGYSPYRSNMDQAGRVQNIAAFGDAQTQHRRHDISIAFQYGFFQDEVNLDLAGGGVVDNDAAMLRATTLVAGDKATVETRGAILYQSGYDAQCMFTAAFTKTDGTAKIRQHIGAFDGSDGYVIGAEHGHLVIERYKGGLEVEEIDQHDFSLDKVDGTGVSGFHINIEYMNIYRIQYGYLGILPATFEVFGGSRLGWIPMHTIDTVNIETDTIINNPYLPIRMTCEIVSGIPDVPVVEVRSGSWYGGTIGGGRTAGDLAYFAVTNAIDLPSNGIPQALLAVRNKGSFRTFINRLRLDMVYFSFVADGNKAVTFDVYANPILTGEIWNDIDTNNSIVEVAINQFAWSGGRYLGAVLVNKTGNEIITFPLAEVRLNPNDVFVVVATSDSGSEVAMSARWGEAR